MADERTDTGAPAATDDGRAPIDGLPVVYEDERLIVVDKPPGLLSQPGRTVVDSVVERIRAARPEARGPMMMHRLDMDTSGLLVLAKDADAHRALSVQFERREVIKRYRARLERAPPGLGGRIALPLARDPDDRPRQRVRLEGGRASVTLWRLDDGDRDGRARLPGVGVVLHPLSGRTHQLRVHAADPRGLDAPIVGDRLYGREGGRLWLHAEALAFTHPGSGARQICLSTMAFDAADATVAAPAVADLPGEHR